jgi:hypothetical protein
MEAMESIVQIAYSGVRGCITTEVGPIQRKIIQAFGLEIDA